MNREPLSVAEIEAYIENALEQWRVPGGAVAILKDDQIISGRGYGSREIGKQLPITTDTLFAIGSCSKAFTATLIGILVDEDALGWDDKVVHFLPEFKLYDPWITQEVTIRDLLCHRTGLQRSIRLMYREKVFDSDDYIQRMRYMRPIGGFRTRFGYNNPHYITAGKIAESVTGQAWKTLIQERIFLPLGMSNSYPTYQDLIQSGKTDVAVPHANLNSGLFPAELCVLDPVESVPWTNYGENAAGSIIATLGDLTNWLQVFMQGGKYQGEQFLSLETHAELTAPQMIIKPGESDIDAVNAVGIDSNFLSYSLGWYVCDYRGQSMIFHPGQVHGFVSAVAYLPKERIGGIILLNSYHTMLHPMFGYFIFDAMLGIRRDYANEMRDLVVQWRAGVESELQPLISSRSTETPPAGWLEQFAGIYKSDLFGEMSITFDGRHLLHKYGTSGFYDANLETWGGETFLVNYHNKLFDPEFLTFVFDDHNKVAALVVKDVDTFNRI